MTMAAQAALKPLNIRNVRAGALAARQYVNDEKITITRTTIAKLQYGDRWTEEYISYVGTVSRQNEYKDHERFFRVMKAKPEWVNRKWTFFPSVEQDSALLREALLYAWDIIYKQSLYHQDSGRYGKSFRFFARTAGAATVERELISQLPDADAGTVYEIVNPLAYASRLETVALYYHRMQGIMFYAAQLTRKKYKDLSVAFNFVPSSLYGVSHTPRSYNLPRLQIGRREDLAPRLKRPGSQHNRRRRAATRSRRRRS
jgi:hypothetical protein